MRRRCKKDGVRGWMMGRGCKEDGECKRLKDERGTYVRRLV